jgi:hypothetical protein
MVALSDFLTYLPGDYSQLKGTAGVMKLEERYTKVEATKAKDAVARRVKSGSLEVMQGAAYKAHITKRTGRR